MAEIFSFLKNLESTDIGDIFFDEPLKNHCSWRIGGPADLLVEPHSIQQIINLQRLATQAGLPLVVIGEGSNLLFHDEGVRGVVVKIARKFSKFSINKNCVVAESGIWVPKLSRAIGRSGLTGMEHAIGIPGTLGGLILMNGGSKRESIGTNVRKVWAVNRQCEIICFTQEECQFSHRHSIFQNSGLIIIMVELGCEVGDPRLIRSEMLDTMKERRRKFPLKEPNCGSVFKSNPQFYETIGPPGKAIEGAGLKGLRIGDAQVSFKHANFIVNLGQAKAFDVLKLIKHIREEVFKKTNHVLGCEVRHVSQNGKIMPVDKFL
jgi:UDP-N-acetylmuramate dehydrogenase